MSLPVDPERLRRQFPALTEDDLAAYVAVTRRVLASPQLRGRILRGVMTAAAAARAKGAAGEPLSADERTASRYLEALEKMQGRVAPSGRGD